MQRILGLHIDFWYHAQMNHGENIERYVQQYYQTRPNKEQAMGKLAIFFLATSGAGKSTIRQRIVDELGATYVCNDEVRAMLGNDMRNLKAIVTATWQQIDHQAANHCVVFDSSMSSYYMHEDSYYNLAQKAGYATFIIAIDIPPQELEARIVARQRPDTQAVLDLLPAQLEATHAAMQALHPDIVVGANTDYAEVIACIQAKL